MKTKTMNILTILAIIFALMAFGTTSQQNNKKLVPEEYKIKVNPYKEDASLKMVGLRNFNRHCVSCHGKTGKGDGVMSKNLKTSPGNLTTKTFQGYTDGEIYYMSFIGGGERPDLMKLIPTEEEKWAVVNYVRTLLTEQ